VTGKDDVISDGTTTIIVSNGNALLGKITGVFDLPFFAHNSVWLLSGFRFRRLLSRRKIK